MTTNIPSLTNPTYSLTNDGLSSSNEYISMTMYEHIIRGGAPIYLFKLLGLKERESDTLFPLTYFSNKELPYFESANASGRQPACYFKSFDKGLNVVANTYLGIDCSYIKLSNSRKYYSNNAVYMIEVRSLVIKQSENNNERASLFKVERSDDGKTWISVDLITPIQDGSEHTYYIKQSVITRYWRVKPIKFNGGVEDRLVIHKCIFSTKSQTSITDVNIDHGIIENRLRSYATTPIEVKATYMPKDIDTVFNGFGIFNTNKQEITIHFESTVELLTRPIVIGDIIEFPFEGQYDVNMRLVKRMMEVTDVSWSVEGYTPGYKPILQQITVEPLTASEENKDVVNELKKTVGSKIFNNVEEYLGIQDTQRITDNISNQSLQAVPETGLNNQNIDSKYAPQTHLLYSDAMPPDGESYTEGFTLPDIKTASNGEYFRLLYENLDIPARLYKFSCSKKRWVFMEEDSRSQQDVVKKQTNDTLLKGISPR